MPSPFDQIIQAFGAQWKSIKTTGRQVLDEMAGGRVARADEGLVSFAEIARREPPPLDVVLEAPVHGIFALPEIVSPTFRWAMGSALESVSGDLGMEPPQALEPARVRTLPFRPEQPARPAMPGPKQPQKPPTDPVSFWRWVLRSRKEASDAGSL